MKRCTKCQQKKELEAFHSNIRSKDGRASWCKECNKKNSSENRHKPHAKSRRLELAYGATLKELEDLYKKQEGKCAICGDFKAEFAKSSGLYVDHNHESGEIRGLLCNTCNIGLGMMKDDPIILAKAISYLAINKKS